jgi:large subunit ribosomal protein L10
MKKKSEKEKDLEALEGFRKAQNIFVTGFEKLTVQQDFELRKTVRGAGGNYKVVKNNLAEKASEGTPAEDMMSNLKGMTSMAYTEQGSGGAGQGADRLCESESGVHVQGGHGGGPRIDVKSIQELANLPSREEILRESSFPDQASAQRLVTAIGGVGRNLAVVVDQGVKENKFSQ